MRGTAWKARNRGKLDGETQLLSKLQLKSIRKGYLGMRTSPLLWHILFVSVSLLISGCDEKVKQEKCPQGQTRVIVGLGWQCKESGTSSAPSSPRPSGLTIVLDNIADAACFGTQEAGVANSNGVPMRIQIRATPRPPSWPAIGTQEFTIPANTPISRKYVIGRTKYVDVEDCRLINYTLISAQPEPQ